MNKHGKYGEKLYDKYIAATTIIYSIDNTYYNNVYLAQDPEQRNIYTNTYHYQRKFMSKKETPSFNILQPKPIDIRWQSLKTPRINAPSFQKTGPQLRNYKIIHFKQIYLIKL